jgi:hypothetical protein
VAEVFGLDEARVAQLDGRELHPIRRSDGSWTYEPREVGALVAGQTVSGPVTARAFEMFVAGKSDADVVIATLQPARRIRELRQEYDEMSGCLTIDRARVARLSAALGVSAIPTAEELVTTVTSGLASRWRSGFEEGRAEVEDFGEVVNPATGERRRVLRSDRPTSDHADAGSVAASAVSPISSPIGGADLRRESEPKGGDQQ